MIAEVVDADIEKRAHELAETATFNGPSTAPEIVAEYERRLALDEKAASESQARFEAGEITEEEVYEGDLLLSCGLYPVLLELRLGGKVLAAFVPADVKRLKECPEHLEDSCLPRARAKLAEVIADHLAERRKERMKK